MEEKNKQQKSPFALTGKTLGIFWAHAMKYPLQAWWLVIGSFILTALSNYIPLLYRDLIDLLAKGNTAQNFEAGIRIIIFVLAVDLTQATVRRTVNFTHDNFLSRVMKDLVNMCYAYLHKHSISFFHSNFIGSIVTKVKRYERAFEVITDQITYDLGRTSIEACIIFSILTWQYPNLAIIVIIWAVCFLIFSYFFSIFKLPYDIRKAAADTHTTGQLADSLTNNINIKIFTNYSRENDRFHVVTEEQYKLRKKSWYLGSTGDIFQGLSMVFIEFWVMYVALHSWQAGAITVGGIALVQMYLGRIFEKLWSVGKNIRTIYEALADANEMTEMILKPHEIQDASDAKKLKVQEGAIEFKDVSFGYYRESAVLSQFNLTIKAGERVALIGSSGGGKSTIAKLLFRFHDVTGGEILIDGQNIAGVSQDSLRSALSFVPQDPILFHRSLMENIRYAKPSATDAQVIKAAKLAHAHEFITSFREGYDTLVGERGLKLSGGERQRVAIARAILRDAPILVLDEATSSLDSESEQFIQDAMKTLMDHCTTIVIAHRLSTIMQMDRIIVIGDGKIIEEGKHKELLKAKQGMYQKLWQIQAGGFAA